MLDLDGTLVDTNHLHVIAWCRAFRRTGHDVPMYRIHQLIGMGGDDLIAELVGHDAPEVSEAWAEEFHHLRPEVRALPGARDLVRELHTRHQVVVFASSAPEEDVSAFRELLDVEEWIAGATSTDDAEAAKPHPDIFEVAMDRFDLDPAATLAVGDAVWDARAAARAGIGFIGVESGGTSREVLAAEGALHVACDPAALTELLRCGGIAGLRSPQHQEH
ncbi:HAD family hydrolase [Aquihabitans daechungensis]|uniref:HAD family hydrolase n=1 Tax=Aquihabitans daechungensis TaxID=1052257 RepID=UPI003B9E1AC5